MGITTSTRATADTEETAAMSTTHNTNSDQGPQQPQQPQSSKPDSNSSCSNHGTAAPTGGTFRCLTESAARTLTYMVDKRVHMEKIPAAATSNHADQPPGQLFHTKPTSLKQLSGHTEHRSHRTRSATGATTTSVSYHNRSNCSHLNSHTSGEGAKHNNSHLTKKNFQARALW